jgi:hypothetical protein
MRFVIWFVGVLIFATVFYVAGIVLGFHGRHLGPGTPAVSAIPDDSIDRSRRRQFDDARRLDVHEPRQILFGDLHVHTTYSADAFMLSLPMLQGEGAHPVADACDFARYCSALDFWSINDHAEGIAPRVWEETKKAIRQCNAVANPQDPDVVAYLGWEWSQVGLTTDTHYGHKNVVLRDLDDDRIPARPIGAGGVARAIVTQQRPRDRILWPLYDFRNRQRYYDYDRFLREVRDTPVCASAVAVRDLPADCMEEAPTPATLFEKLRDWGSAAIVIPHGTAWGAYTPAAQTWDAQLAAAQHDTNLQTLVELYSGHGSSEEYRDWRAIAHDDGGQPYCPEPSDQYTPACWRAGEIIRERCNAAGIDATECEQRAAEARRAYVRAGNFGSFTIPGASGEQWLDAGQCPDCFMPVYNLRPASTTQYMAAISNFDEDTRPRRFRFGYIGSSDNHSARPGPGYKEFARGVMSDAPPAPRDKAWVRRLTPELGRPEARAIEFDPADWRFGPFLPGENERLSSYLSTGGLVAVHSTGRDRHAIWEALARREVYATSGERLLLWFDLVNDPATPRAVRAMGSLTVMRQTPRFRVRALGSLKQKPGCPDHTIDSLAPDRIENLCRGECYNPSDSRKRIRRIEVVRIRPQATPGENVAGLIEDPWRVLPCAGDPAGCAVEFEDPEFAIDERDTAYYVRAIQEPSTAINGAGLDCDYDADGRCVAIKPCWADNRTSPDDDCLGVVEERAWSSPIYVDYQR